VVRLQSVTVGSAERVSKLLAGVGDVELKALGGKVKTSIKLSAVPMHRIKELYIPDEPKAALSGSVLAGLELVADEVLDGTGLGGSGGLAGTELL
jgi:hypothetical protein